MAPARTAQKRLRQQRLGGHPEGDRATKIKYKLNGGAEQTHVTVKNEGPKVGRNDPCPCGSGKKYKNCCGRNQ